MVGRRPSVVSKLDDSMLPLLQGQQGVVATGTQTNPSSGRNSVASYESNNFPSSGLSSGSLSSSSSDSDSDSLDDSRRDRASKARGSLAGSAAKGDKQQMTLWKRALVQLRLKLGGVKLRHIIMFLLLVLLIVPPVAWIVIQRIVVWKKGSRTWVFSPIMDIGRPCPAPEYETMGSGNGDTFTGNDLKICLTTLTDEKTQQKAFLRRTVRWRNYDNILELTWESKKKYAKKHGYHLFDGSGFVDVSRPAQWSKILAVQHLLVEENCDWVMWHDADTLFMNTDVRIQDFLPTDPNKDLLVTVDSPNPGYNSGSWLVKNSDWGRRFLQDWWDMKSFVRLPGQSLSGDNDAFKALLASYSKEQFETHVGVPPRCTMNSFAKFLRPKDSKEMTEEELKAQPWYMSENFYHKGDFLVHVPGYDNKIGTLEMLIEKIQ